MENLLADYELEIDPASVFRLMGYPRAVVVSDELKEIFHAQRQAACELSQSWGGEYECEIAAVDKKGVRLEDGIVLSSRMLARIMRNADRLRVCLVTCGERIVEEVRSMFEAGQFAEALALDSIASIAVEEMSNYLNHRICSEVELKGWAATMLFSPGYSDWPMRDQQQLFKPFKDSVAPVSLNESMMLIPEKSMLGVCGIVPEGKDAPVVHKCSICNMKNCQMRQQTFKPEEWDIHGVISRAGGVGGSREEG